MNEQSKKMELLGVVPIPKALLALGLPTMIRLRFIRKTHCQKDFMLWRGSARLGGVSGVDFNILGNPAELVRKLKVNTDIAVFVNLDMVYQFNQNFAGQLFDVLIFCKSYQRGMLLVNAV